MIRKQFKPTFTAPATVKTLDSIKMRTQAVSCEAIAVHRPNLTIVAKLADIFDDTKALYANALSGLSKAPKFVTGFIGKGKLERVLDSHQYTDLIDVRVPCLAGQTATWLTVLAAMEEHVKVIKTLDDDVFDPINQYVGAVLNDPERMSNNSSRPNVRTVSLSEVKANYSGCIGTTTVDEFTFGKAFRRNADVLEVETRLSRVLKDMAGYPPKWMKDQVDRTNGNLTKLLLDIQNPDLSYQPTSGAVTYLSEMIFVVAEQVSLYAALIHWLEQTTKALELTEERVVKAKK